VSARAAARVAVLYTFQIPKITPHTFCEERNAGSILRSVRPKGLTFEHAVVVSVIIAMCRALGHNQR
jgi:hypothetical protein